MKAVARRGPGFAAIRPRDNGFFKEIRGRMQHEIIDIVTRGFRMGQFKGKALPLPVSPLTTPGMP